MGLFLQYFLNIYEIPKILLPKRQKESKDSQADSGREKNQEVWTLR